jgi:hypothetical protein
VVWEICEDEIDDELHTDQFRERESLHKERNQANMPARRPKGKYGAAKNASAKTWASGATSCWVKVEVGMTSARASIRRRH